MCSTEYLLVHEVRKILECSVTRLDTLERKGELVPRRRLPTGRRLYHVDDVNSYLESLTIEADKKKEDNREGILSIREVCSLLKCSTRFLDSLEKRGELMPVRRLPTSRKRFYCVDDVNAYLERISVGRGESE